MGSRVKKTERTQPDFARKPAFARMGLVLLLCRPNSPTPHALHNGELIVLDVSPLDNGGPDQRRQSGNIENVAEWKIIGVAIGQDVGRGELGHNRNSVRNECEVNKVALSRILWSASGFMRCGLGGWTH
jgi:hypothetical protein